MRFFSIQKSIISLFALTLLGFLLAVASAALEVNFEATPLFAGANVLPGDAVTRTVTVTNTGTEAEDVIFSVENTFSDGLADVMEIAVTSGAEVFVDTTFSTLFTAGEVPLGTLPAASSKTYEFTSLLSAEIGNEYQLTQLGFDLLIGFSGGETVVDNPPNGGGGGGRSSEFSLFNEEVEVSDSAAATLTWNTNRPGTSYAVCGNDDDGPFVLDSDDELFGYVFASTEETVLLLTHAVEFIDLAAGDYSCRVASREEVTDEYTVSGELGFSIIPDGQIAGVSDSQPLDHGNYFQPFPTVAGIHSGGKGSNMTYEEYRAQLDELKSAREANAASDSTAGTSSDSAFISPVVASGDTTVQDAQSASVRSSFWYLYLIVLIAILALVWKVFTRKRFDR